MSSSLDLNFIDDVGAAINEIYANDPSQSEWFNKIKDEYNNTYQYPDDTFNRITDYLHSRNTDGSYSSLIEKIDIITAENDDYDNLLGAIFFPNFSDENINEDAEEEIIILSGDGEEEEEEVDKDSPSYFFTQIINFVSTTLCISTDISYLLLKKYGWNKDQSLSNWFSSQDQILKDLRIKFGSEMVPNKDSSLEIKECGTGKCPLCNKNGSLYQLYCGHKICKDCLNAEVENKISHGKLPFCHQQTKERKDCNSEIIIKSSMYPKLFDQYKEVLLKDKFENNSIDVKLCPNPNCGHLVAAYDRLNKYIGRCSHCFAAVCYKCNNESHAPLEDCAKIKDFCQKIPNQMCRLLSDQNKWEIREANLKDYRCKNKDEVVKALKDLHKKASEEQNKEVASEKKAYDEICKNIPKLNDQIESIKKKIRESIGDSKLAKQINQLSKQIITTRQEIDRNEMNKKDYQQFMADNEAKRKSQLQYIVFDNDILIDGLSSSSSYKDSITKFHDTQMSNAYAAIGADTIDENAIKFHSEKCPKCKKIITRYTGINKMQCSCGFSLCKVCHENWDQLHDEKCVCPKYIQKIDIKNDAKSKDANDNKFYPPPMTLKETMHFILFENYYASFMRQKEIYEKLKKDFYSNSSKGVKNVLIEIYQKDNDHQESQSCVSKLLNTVLLAQSMVTWSYPAIYFAIKNGRDKYAKFLKRSFASLHYNNSIFIEKIKQAKGFDSKYFKIEISKIDNEIKEFFDDESKFV